MKTLNVFLVNTVNSLISLNIVSLNKPLMAQNNTVRLKGQKKEERNLVFLKDWSAVI